MLRPGGVIEWSLREVGNGYIMQPMSSTDPKLTRVFKSACEVATFLAVRAVYTDEK